MKKLIAILSVCLIVLGVCVACGNTEDTTAETETTVTETASETAVASEEATDENAPEFPYMVINNEPFCVTVKEGFDNAGVTTYICDATAKYSFLCDDDDVSWSVYVLDAPFEDAARYLSQAETPVLSGNGVAEIEEGKYVYLACSCNAFTAEVADDEVLSVYFADDTLSGNYADSVSQRATAVIVEQPEEDEDEIWVQISWANSAFETYVWTMECEKTADGKLTYDDCEKVIVTTDEYESTTEKEVYEDGTGYFTIQDGKLLWNGASEAECKDCVFEIEA